MKAHLILSEIQYTNNDKVIRKLRSLLKKSCSNYSDQVSYFENYDRIDIYQQIIQDKSKVKLLFDFPSDLINSVDFGNSTNLLFINDDVDLLENMHNKFKIICLPKFCGRTNVNAVAKYLFYGICHDLVLKTDWDISSKDNLSKYYTEKQAKEAKFLNLSSKILEYEQ